MGSIIKRAVFDSIIFAYLAIIALIVVVKPTEDQMLMLGKNSLIFLGLFVLGGAVSFLLNGAKIKTLGEQIFAPDHITIEKISKPWYKKLWTWQLLVVFVVTVVAGVNQTNFSIYELTDERGFSGAMRLFGDLANPNLEILPKAVLKIIETIYIAFMATVLAVPLAFILSFFTAKNVMTHPVAFVIYLGLRTFLNVVRSVEALIWAIIFSVWVGIGPFAGMLALMLHSVASLAKQYSEIVESVSDGPIEGIRATGANFFQVIWFAIVPQVVLPYIAFTIYRWDINVRMATIIGLVGGGGIGTMLIKYQGQAMWQEVGCIVVVIAVVVWLMDTASAYLREAIK